MASAKPRSRLASTRPELEPGRPEIPAVIDRLRRVPPDPRALGRVLSWIENRDPRGGSVVAGLPENPRPALRVGVTGAPGVGKSSVVGALVPRLRGRGLRVAVLAMDPTSPLTGGALLGDRVRMPGHAADAGLYIRSFATRGGGSGIPACTGDAAALLEAAGFEVIVIETAGVGQLELEIVDEADYVLLLLSPESGDTMQFLKGGITEVVDRLVVNKADRPGADDVIAVAAELSDDRSLAPPVRTSVVDGDGIDELAGIIADKAADRRSGKWGDPQRDRERFARRLARRTEARWIARGWDRVGGERRVTELARDVVDGRISFEEALHDLVERGENPVNPDSGADRRSEDTP